MKISVSFSIAISVLCKIRRQINRKNLPQPLLEKPIANPDNLIDLPTPENLVNPGKDFYEIINQRRSRRKYTAESIDLEHLSFLLWCTQGVKKYLIEKK